MYIHLENNYKYYTIEPQQFVSPKADATVSYELSGVENKKKFKNVLHTK